MKAIVFLILYISNIKDIKTILLASSSRDNSDSISSNVFSNITDHIGILFNFVFSSLNQTQPDNLCYQYLWPYYQSDTKDKLALTKLIFDSSKNKNDVGTSSKCRNNNYSYSSHQKASTDLSLKDFTYLIIQTTSVYSTRTNHYGICFLFSPLCNKTDYITLAQLINDQTNVFYSKDDLSTNWKINLFNMKETETLNQFKATDIVAMIPLFIILIVSLFSVFPSIPTFLFQNCFKSHKASSTQLDSMRVSKGKLLDNTRLSERSTGERSSINKKYLCQFKSCFSLGENGEELFNLRNESTDFSNESGLSYIKGIRGLAMIFVLFGAIFDALYHHPSRIIADEGGAILYGHVFYSFVIFGERTAYSILFSCSGFCLAYKLMCYLDDKLVDQTDHDNKKAIDNVFDFNKPPETEKEREGDISNLFGLKEKDNKETESIQMQNLLSKGESIDQSSLLDDKDPITIEWFFFFRFVLYQLPKYILVILTFFLGKYSLNSIMNLIVNVGPMFEILKQRMIDDFSLIQIACHSFIIQINYKTIANVIFSNNPKGSFLEVVWMSLNEIEFFFFSTLLIFICFKKEHRLDFICIIFASVILFVKVIISITISHLKPSEYYYNYPFYYCTFLPTLNYQYYLIGIIFGLINYAIQKEITFRDVMKRKKPYLLTIVSIVTFLKKKRLTKLGGLITLIIISLVLLFLFYFYSTLQFCGVSRENIKFISNLTYLFDSEAFVILLHVFVILCYLRGENMIYNFLSSNNWGVANKIYFFFILTCKPLIMLIFYQSETRINVNYFSVLFYGLICGFIIFLFSALSYIFLGIPYKRIIKLIFHLKEKSKLKQKKKQ